MSAAAANPLATGERGRNNQHLPTMLIDLKLQILPLSLEYCPNLSMETQDSLSMTSTAILPLPGDHINSKGVLCYFFCHIGTCSPRASQLQEGKKPTQLLVPISLVISHLVR